MLSAQQQILLLALRRAFSALGARQPWYYSGCSAHRRFHRRFAGTTSVGRHGLYGSAYLRAHYKPHGLRRIALLVRRAAHQTASLGRAVSAWAHPGPLAGRCLVPILALALNPVTY